MRRATQVSDEHTWRVVEVGARFRPETFSYFGFEAADEHVRPFGPEAAGRWIAALRDLASELHESLGGEADAEVRIDLGILLADCERHLEHARIEHEVLIPYLDLPRFIFSGLHALLAGETPPERCQAAVARLRRYVGEEGVSPAAAGLEASIRSRLDEPGLLPPYRKAVEEDLGNAGLYLDGIAELIEKRGVPGCERPFARLCRQIDDWNCFVHDTILPRARSDPRLPAALYASHLRVHGIDMSQHELLGRARAAIRERRRELRELTRQLKADARPVDRESPSPDVVELHRRRLRQLRRLFRRQDILSLPRSGFRLKIATAAEAAWLPYPQTRVPPILGRWRGDVEIVLATNDVASPAEGDLPANSWIVTAHEMAHAIQLASLDDTLPRARTIFTTSSDLEGWAVYLEAELAPYLPLVARTERARQQLTRALRTVLEVELHSGAVSVAEAARMLRAELAGSESSVAAELWRFVRQPGQGPSYFAGEARVCELRTEVELALGPRFERRGYHDFLLSRGRVPFTTQRRLVLDGFVAAARPWAA